MAYGNTASRFSQIFTEELSCPVCLEELKEPKCLPSCAHNVCRECLEKMAVRSGNEISCPTCRRVTAIPASGVRGLPTNTVLVKLLEATPGRKERFEIQKALENGKPVVKKMEEKVSDFEKSLDELGSTWEAMEKDIHEKADQLCAVVRKQESSLCAEAKEFYQKKQEMLNRQKSSLTKLHYSASSSVQIAEEVLSQSNVDEMLELSNALIQQLEEVTTLNLDEADFNTSSDEELIFSLNEEASFIIDERKIGRISRKILQPNKPLNSTTLDWSRSGEVIYKLGHKGSKVGYFKSPAGVAVNEFGDTAITDFFNNRVQVFDSRLKFLFEFGKKGVADGQFNGPTGIAYTPYNNIVVFDSKNSRIQIFNRKGEFVSKLGKPGSNVGEFGRQGSLFVDSSGDIIVTDTDNTRVQVFYNNCEFKLQYGNRGTEGFDQPLATVAMDDEYFTSDSGNNCIKVFNTEGEYVRQFGREGSGMGEFQCPRGLAIDTVNKLLLVTDSDTNHIQVFHPTGAVLNMISTKKEPVALAVMQNNYILVCSYLGNCV